MSKRGPAIPPPSKLASNLIQFNTDRMSKSYAFPASTKQAQIHEIANIFGFNSLVDKDGAPVPICPCCKLPINTRQIPIQYATTPDISKEKVKEDYFLSSGIAMFFTFIKMAICYLLLRFILTDAFNIISSIAGTYCRDHPCDSLLTSEISSYNKIDQQNLVYILDLLNLITIIFSIAFFNLYRKIQYKIETLINVSQHTQEDYSLFLTNIPILLIDEDANPNNITFDYAEKLKKYFEAKLDDWITKIPSKPQDQLEQIEKEFLSVMRGKRVSEMKKVTSVTMCFDLSEMEVLRDMRKKLMEKYVTNVAKREKNNASNQLIEEERDSNSYENILPQINLVNQEEILLSQKFAQDSSMAFNLTHFVGRAFICFEYQHFRDYILRQFDRDNDNFLRIRPDFAMKVALASTPSDILWYNMKVEGSTRVKYIIISYLILVMVLAFAFGGTLYLTKVKYDINQNTEEGDDTLSLFLTVFMTVVTLVINYILGVIVKHLTQYEQHQTKSKFIFSHVVKAVLTQFINTTIIYYASSKITNSPYLSQQGLVVQVSSLFITSAIIQIALNLANPSAIIAWAMKWLKYRNKTEVSMFQRDLNTQYQRAQFDVVDRYSYYILQIYACSFYSYLAPISTPCLILTLLAQFWIDKWNLFKRSSCKNQMDFFLSRTMLKIFQISVFVFAFGNFLFSAVLHNRYVHSVNVAALIIAGVYTLFIMFAPRHLEKRIFGSYEQIQTKSYSECMKDKQFKEQYWTSNPATKFVREIDLNTKQVVQQSSQRAQFANLNNLKQAKLQLDQLLKEEEPKLELDSSFRSGRQEQKVNRSTIRDNDL